MGIVVVFTLLAIIAGLNAQGDDFYYGTFPDDFIFGAATASYQIEGAWNLDGKGEHIWDEYVHRDPSPINNGDTGDVACDSYHLYKEDVRILKEMGVQHYRFSISWARILPDGTTNVINPAGVDFYNNLIDELLANEIIPMVTLYHFELPQALQTKFGGFLNETEFTDTFGNYARTCFKLFGDRVKYWITFNEPWITSVNGYGEGSRAPGLRDPGVNDYIAAQSHIKSHARAWHIYDDEFRQQQQGQVGITLSSDWYEPNTTSSEDVAAAERGMQFNLGWYTHPIYSQDGDYPPIMREYVNRKSQEQGYSVSRLPVLTQEWIEYIRGACDFVGINHYTTYMAIAGSDGSAPSFINDQDVIIFPDPSWNGSATDWLWVTPWGMRSLVNWIKNEYGNIPVYITENGYADHPGEMQDVTRSNYIRDYMNELLKAVNIDGCNVKGYTVWTLMDNFASGAGYSIRFGLHYVDFDDPTLQRIPKLSAGIYKKIIQDRGFPDPTKIV